MSKENEYPTKEEIKEMMKNASPEELIKLKEAFDNYNEKHGLPRLFTKKFTKDEKTLLLYFETCLVDAYGRAETRYMNKEDIEIAKKLTEAGLIEFGRLSMKAIEKLRRLHGYGKVYTHWVRFSDKAWELAHKWRKERSDRMIGRHNAKLLREIP